MSHIQRFNDIVVTAITDFLPTEVTQPSYNVQDVICPTVVSLEDVSVDRDDVAAELCHRLMWYYKSQMSLTVRYKLLTILFLICRKFVDSTYHSIHKCKACGNTGWWCRGCGSSYKIDAMEEAGISDADEIRNYQFAGCDQPMVPCFLCNRDGQRENEDEGYAVDPDFWATYVS
jgi:hypothetical protein